MNGVRFGRFEIPEQELDETFETSGGPGGQHANRSSTAVRLRFSVPDSSLPQEIRHQLAMTLGDQIEVTAADSRSQFRNRAIARKRLAEKLGEALIPDPPRKPTRPTRSSRRRRLEAKRARSEKKRLRRRPGPDE